MLLHPCVRQIAQRYKELDACIRNGGCSATEAIGRFAWVTKRVGELGIGSLGSYVENSADDEAGSATFVITNSDEDRDGDIVIPEGYQGDAYAKNPVWFFGHQQAGWEVPIGTSRTKDNRVAVLVEPNRVLSTCYFDRDDPDADYIYGKVKRRILNATSVAFVPVEAYRRDEMLKARQHSGSMLPLGWYFKRWEHTETSIVGVPSNAGAIRDSYDKEKKYVSRRMQKALRKYCAEPRGRCFSGWCPCAKGGDGAAISGSGAVLDAGDKIVEAKRQVTKPNSMAGPRGSGTNDLVPATQSMPPAPPPATKSEPSDDISPAKACKILEDGNINGKPLTDAQRGMFGAACAKHKKSLEFAEITNPPIEAEREPHKCGCKECKEHKPCKCGKAVVKSSRAYEYVNGKWQWVDEVNEPSSDQSGTKPPPPPGGWNSASAKRDYYWDVDRNSWSKSLNAAVVKSHTLLNNAIRAAQNAGYKQLQDYSGEWIELSDWIRSRKRGWDWDSAELQGTKIVAVDPLGVKYTWQLRKNLTQADIELPRRKPVTKLEQTVRYAKPPEVDPDEEGWYVYERGEQVDGPFESEREASVEARKGLNEASGGAGGYTVPPQFGADEADLHRSAKMAKRYVVKTVLGYVTKGGDFTEDMDDAETFDEPEAKEKAEEVDGEIGEAPPFMPKASAKLAAHMYNHHKEAEDWLTKALDDVDHPGMDEGFREHLEHHLSPAMQHLKDLVHSHHGGEGDDPDSLMDKMCKALETDGTPVDPGTGEAAAVATGHVPAEEEAPPAETPPAEEGKGALANWAAEEETEPEHKGSDHDSEAIMERYQTEKGNIAVRRVGVLRKKQAAEFEKLGKLKRIAGRLYVVKAGDGKCPKCGATLTDSGKCPKCGEAESKGLDGPKDDPMKKLCKDVAKCFKALAKDESMPARYKSVTNTFAAALSVVRKSTDSPGDKPTAQTDPAVLKEEDEDVLKGAADLADEMDADDEVPKQLKSIVRAQSAKLRKALTDAGKVQSNSGKGSALSNAGKVQRTGGKGSPLTDAGALQANKPTGKHGEFIEGDPDPKEAEEVDEAVDPEVLKVWAGLTNRFRQLVR